MSTTARQDQDFLKALISDSLLEEAIDWIGSNLEPEEVFSDASLQYWAESNGYKRE